MRDRSEGNVLQRAKYSNTVADARTFAQKIADRYGRCRAACESTTNLWSITFDAFGDAGMDINLADTLKMAIIARAGTKTDKIDAEKIAQTPRVGVIPELHAACRHQGSTNIGQA